MFSLAHLSTECYKKGGREIKEKNAEIFHGRPEIEKKSTPSKNTATQDFELLDLLNGDLLIR